MGEGVSERTIFLGPVAFPFRRMGAHVRVISLLTGKLSNMLSAASHREA